MEAERDRIVTLVSELLDYSHRVPAVRTILDAIVLAEANGATLTSVLESVESNNGETMFRVRGLDKALANALDALEEQNLHFHPRAATTRKRKRNEFEAQQETEIPKSDVGHVIKEALRSLQNSIVDGALLTTLQLRLHAIFISEISSLTPSTPAVVRDTLNKMSKLIQLLGVLSNLQLPIIPVVTPSQTMQEVADTDTNTNSPSTSTSASHPCPHSTCLKTFQKPYDLRIHSRVHANHRPFACLSCPMTFTRNHDLQRHVRTHPTPRAGVTADAETGASALVAPAVRCTVCLRTFSRRDAFLRHTRGGRGKNKGGGDKRPPCAAALGESVANIAATPMSMHERSSQWEKPVPDPFHHSQSTELAPSQTTSLGMLDHPVPNVQSDSNDPFSIFSGMDFTQIDIDLSQLLALPQFTENIPGIEL